MNRAKYFDYIEERLNFLSHRINSRGKLNILDLHQHSENFYLHFFNLLFDYKLENLNVVKMNVEAIDLIDHVNLIVIQVSATSTKQKIESALEKDKIRKYNDYNFKFICISKPASKLKNKKYSNPHSIKFDPKNDIYDINTILEIISSKDIDKFKSIYSFIKKELGSDVDMVKLDSNLATVINILSKEDWDQNYKIDNQEIFKIKNKITYNDLNEAKKLIEEYCIYYKKIDEKYEEFDKLGVNKSISVLASIQRQYLRYKDSCQSPDKLFFKVIDVIQQKVIDSNNFDRIPIDELQLCIDILVVDAFIRCKIFENPKEDDNVAS